jgi:primosomal protein N' (replication factor Y)
LAILLKFRNFAIEMQNYADVILPLPLGPTFTYSIPQTMQSVIKVGMRAIVPFGAHKFYTGIVSSITPNKPKNFEVKEIATLPDAFPIVRHPQLKLWEWMASYYLCSQGDVMKAAIPAGLKIESETQVEINPDVEPAEAVATLSEKEAFIWQQLCVSGKMYLAALAKETGVKNIAAVVNRMIEKGVVVISEKIIERYRPKREYFVRIKASRENKDSVQAIFEAVKRARKQEATMLALIEMSNFMHPNEPLVEVTRAALMERAKVSTPLLSEMSKKGLIEIYWKETSRFKYNGPIVGDLPILSQAQQEALSNIHKQFLEHKVTLFHGVTSSGKTEVYLHLIDYVLKQNMQVLYLVPEIALTTQLTHRLQRVFGDNVIIYHSRFSDNERVEIWHRLLRSSDPCVVIGARSSIFLPFAKLGLVIVDEEHEPSYKQYDPAPRYNGRDVATVLASMHGAKTLLGSATPTIETFYKANSGKYGLVTLYERFGGISLPDIKIVDLIYARNRMQLNGALATETSNVVRNALSKYEQVIFFHNRRGYAPIAKCKQCAYTPKCECCDVSLTYHRYKDKLICHYCGSVYPLPDICPVCKEPSIEVLGFGTERVEDDVERLFPDARVLRMDLDTTRNKDDYADIIDSFSEHKADILIGTQMVTKGLDFKGVSTVVVLNADNIINFPDFRSSERAFNMLEQVAGRAGRKGSKGLVIVQTRDPENKIIKFLCTHDYVGFYERELKEREAFHYPPFSRVVYIYIKHRDFRVIDDIAAAYGAELRRLFGNRVFGPEEPQIGKVQNLYIRKIMLKVELQASMSKIKEILRDVYVNMIKKATMKGMIIYYDVDPQ